MELKTHYLYPSTIYAQEAPTRVTTILGTCVAVCLWDTHLKIGGINHFMLPLWNGNGLASPKYGNIAIQKLIEKMSVLGSQKEDLVAKVFGGKHGHETDSFKIGERNEKLALDLLSELKIPIVSKSTGGNYGRKILFNSATGEVFMKYLQTPTP